MCYNGFVKAARSLRAPPAMLVRHAVLLTPLECAVPKKRGVGAFPRFRSSQLSTPHLPPHCISDQKRRRPSRSDGGSCEKGVRSSGEKFVSRDSVVRGR